MKGIDISSWQSGLDIAKLNIDFLILKISEGRTWADPSFDTFYASAKVPVGAYVYSHATTIQAAEQEAEKALSLLNRRPCPLGVYMDVEAAEQLLLSDNQLTDVVKAFCNVIRAGGYIAGAYGSEGNLWSKVRPDSLDGGTLVWVAKWSSVRPSMPCDLWQYTDQARLDYYSGNLDGDEAISDRMKDIICGNTPATAEHPAEPNPQGKTCDVSVSMPVLSFGDHNDFVKIMQIMLISRGFNCGWMGADGWFGEQTKIALYQATGSTSCGSAEWAALLEVK